MTAARLSKSHERCPIRARQPRPARCKAGELADAMLLLHSLPSQPIRAARRTNGYPLACLPANPRLGRSVVPAFQAARLPANLENHIWEWDLHCAALFPSNPAHPAASSHWMPFVYFFGRFPSSRPFFLSLAGTTHTCSTDRQFRYPRILAAWGGLQATDVTGSVRGRHQASVTNATLVPGARFIGFRSGLSC